MLTVITETELPGEIAGEWDETMEARLRAAESCGGWVSGQILRSLDDPHRRVIVGVWASREDWAAWHEAPAFQETRARLAELGARSGKTRWFETLHAARR